MRAAGFCAAVPFWQERRNAKTVSAESTWTDPPVVVDGRILAARQGDLSGEGIPACRAELSAVIRKLYLRWRFIMRRLPGVLALTGPTGLRRCLTRDDF